MALNNPYALSFDGVDDYTSTVTLPVGLRCLEFWIEIDSDFATGDEPAVTLFQFNSYLHALNLGRSLRTSVTATLRLRQYDGRNDRSWYTLEPILHGLHHIAVNFDSLVDINFVIDGKAATMVQSSQHPGYYQTGLAINGELYNERYKGKMDEVRAWNTPRTLEEIQSNMYKSLVGNEAGLILYWRLDEESGNSALDSSPSGLNATIYGATRVGGLVDLEGLAPPGRVDISATLRGSSSATAKADRVRGLSAHLTGAATATGGKPIRIRGLSANLQGAGTVKARMNLIAALKAHLQGKATLKSNMLVLFVPEGVFVIDADEIFAKNQPSRGQVVANYIEVWVNPLKPADVAEEVYRSKDPVTLPASATQTITVYFDDEPVLSPAITLAEAGANISIIDTKYYAWGADVTIKNAGAAEQTCLIVATGKPLKVQGREKIVKKDEVSIQENGLKKYTFDNPFVQDRTTAELIADKLLSYANVKRDIEIDWRGDPALELADVTMIPECQRRGLDQRGIFYITKQELEFDGGLKAKLEGRKM